MKQEVFEQAADVVLFANGDISLKSSLTGLFLVIISYGLQMGNVFIHNTTKECQFSEDGNVFGMKKQSAVCALNLTKLDKVASNEVSLHMEGFERNLRVLFDESPESRIAMDGVKGTGWRGCKNRSSGLGDNVTDPDYHGWKYR